jgi:GTP-binding protein
VKALEKESGSRVFPISAPLEEGIEPLLDAIIERLGSAAVEQALEAADEKPWSPL